MIDKNSLALLNARDKAALTAAVNENTATLLRVAWGMGWVGTEAEDIVQQTFVTFLQTVPNFEGRSSLRTYLIGILYKKSLEKRRASTREEAVDPIDQVFEKRFGIAGLWNTFPRGPEDEAASRETAVIVEQCIENLPLDQRTAFYLKEVEHQPTETLCNILGITTTHLGVLLFRARNRLRECVQRKWGKNG